MDAVLPGGSYDAAWNGDTDSGQRTPAGFYFVRLLAGGESRVQKVVLVP
jgi:hypothetical protein